MRSIFTDKRTREKCRIYAMLWEQARKKHISFHTPGHKRKGFDITELSYSDNLSCPRGCIAQAEKDIAEILGAARSFILTDGSTCGVLSMLYAVKTLGINKIAVCERSHKSVFNGCAALELTPLVYTEDLNEVFSSAEAVFITSPTYYGEIYDLATLQARCKTENKLLLVDGAHGGHLHFDKKLYAGAYADMWVDGVHKSLPAYTQGAVVSAKTDELAKALAAAVDIFRTTSPSYPVMASVEYAVKYPENTELKNAVFAYAKQTPRVEILGDWTKLCVSFGKNAFSAHKEAESIGVYPEFCDGERVTFYLSPATKKQDFARLKKILARLFEKYPYKEPERIPAPLVLPKNGAVEQVEIERAEGRICAKNCGLFPPCTPLLTRGEVITGGKLALLKQADNIYGVTDNKITVFIDTTKE